MRRETHKANGHKRERPTQAPLAATAGRSVRAGPTRRTLRALIVEDDENDAVLLLRELSRGGLEVDWARVQNATALEDALDSRSWDIVISDFAMTGFDALAALELVKRRQLDLPFIIVSGSISEDMAVLAMKAGANDFVLKDQLKRLVPVIDRELKEAKERAKRRQAEEALRRSEEKFRTLIASMDDVVFTMDRDRRFDGIYGQIPSVPQLRPDLLLGRTAREVFGAEARVHERSAEQALAGQRVVYEWSIEVGNDTRHFQTALSAFADRSSHISGLVGVSRDITSQKQVQAQLLVSDRMASVGTLAAGVAHEINNPLLSVCMNLEFIANSLAHGNGQGGGAVSPAVLEAVADARESADRVGQIVSELRIFSRNPDEEQRPVDTKRMLDSCARMAWNEIRHRARLEKQYDGVPAVLGNEARLCQVFLNLLVNAAQAIPEGHAHDHEVRLVGRARPDGKVEVEVRDTGSGMTPTVLRKLFTPFFTTKPVGKGTGLGLSICHRIVTSFGGKIEVESEPGKGTVFRVILPAAPGGISGRAGLPEGEKRRAKRRGRILIVDDEPSVGAALARHLAEEHEVVVATSGTEALRRLEADPGFDVILCDLMMPEMTGSELHAEMVRRNPGLAERMIFVTGGAFTQAAARFLKELRNPRIQKPFNIDELWALLDARIR